MGCYRDSVNFFKSIYGSTALVDLGHFFSFSIYKQQDSLDGGSARREAATYTQNKRT
jgi:hypothetical protein